MKIMEKVSPTSLRRRAFLKLLLEERRRILEEQAAQMQKRYKTHYGEEVFKIEPLKEERAMNPYVNSVEAWDNYKLALVFENGEQRLFDLKPYLKLVVFARLEKPACPLNASLKIKRALVALKARDIPA
jgi:hypothetical protein